MRKFELLLTGSVVAATVLLAPAATLGWAASTESAQNAIRSALEKWRLAFNDRDESQVCDLFAPDLIANYEGEPERDYASLCQLLRASLQDTQRTYRYSLQINEILVYDDRAVVRLVWKLEIDKTGAPKEIVEEPAVDIFRNQADGSWKISRYLAYSVSP